MEELASVSEDFRTWWAEHRVYQRTHGTNRLRHPIVFRCRLVAENARPQHTWGRSAGASSGSQPAQYNSIIGGLSCHRHLQGMTTPTMPPAFPCCFRRG
ncbi:MmyB family transcriptional regulator [Mycolicibacterium baixiangningiae]|uniref:MmyB family transcriptional regulator n=1 Tax=Mycolicibacterium baixiangningiae TaxID=2761578 RepID=UPI00299F5AAF|nr:hypothetical protein [Mycolicibacterium baixiangningiae]